jgi:hypothetical protein
MRKGDALVRSPSISLRTANDHRRAICLMHRLKLNVVLLSTLQASEPCGVALAFYLPEIVWSFRFGHRRLANGYMS